MDRRGMRVGQPLAPISMVEGQLSSFGPMGDKAGWRLNNELRMNGEQLEESMKRLTEIEETRRKTLAMRLNKKYISEDKKTRLTSEDMEAQVERLYQQGCITHNARLQQVIKKNMKAPQLPESTKMNAESMDELNEKMYNLGMVRSTELLKKLKRKYYPPDKPPPKLSKEEHKAANARLYYDRREEQKAYEERLRKKYVEDDAPWERRKRRLAKAEMLESADRLAVPKTART
eukprot:NODE_2363_length_1081_cov_52.380503_g2345_i0.p1 GENE.NODE_2363_length_1081_cov_52.380503_g2345_i0~~NODE_2363_length_1081_cov_52.380503_g2345_i0.p1  ORF type:complete len:232 (+),score=75.10 NODE_2363_length_1081_cov_52.380503_g2345_i0:243-938(+)